MAGKKSGTRVRKGTERRHPKTTVVKTVKKQKR